MICLIKQQPLREPHDLKEEEYRGAKNNKTKEKEMRRLWVCLVIELSLAWLKF
jgi:hypothetical protein